MKSQSVSHRRSRTRQVYRVPGCTYRLQFNAGFTFNEATDLTEYLRALGITDCYASPILAAGPGSTHGYDVCDSARLNPALGGMAQFESWVEKLKEADLGLLLDIVPNHMGADLGNPWWRDILAHGESSRFAYWFDIDWNPKNRILQGKVLLPILEDHYGKVLEAGKFQVLLGRDGFFLRYHERTLPLAPDSRAWLRDEILRLCREDARSTDSFEDLNALGEVAARLNSSAAFHSETPQPSAVSVMTRQGDMPEVWPALERALCRFNGQAGLPASFNSLHALLQRQHYRLCYWRIAGEELNYRRFFDVAELVALRIELPDVFEAAHELVLRLVHQQKVTGLRIDHPDGLWDPKEYFDRLQQAFKDGTGSLDRSGQSQLYIVAEKILSGQEALSSDWPIAGTTGYDFLNQLNGLFVNRANQGALDKAYTEFAGIQPDFRALVCASKLKVLESSFSGDLRALGRLLKSIAARTRYGIDFTGTELNAAVSAMIAWLPVYRTYVTENSHQLTPEEETVLDQAFDAAVAECSACSRDVLVFLHDILRLRPPGDLDEPGREECRRFAMKFQQLSGPVMAKGLEDTAFYNYNRLISLNEVGGDPGRFGTELAEFHAQNQSRADHWPHTLLATATHDTKRGEDLRARLNVLSEIPEEWCQAALKWSRLNAEKKTVVDGKPAPDSNDEYFLYQTLVGAWISEAETGEGSDVFRQRICEYMLKALREAKRNTSWTMPNEAYERAAAKFVDQILTHSKANQFLDDFMLFQRKVAFFGLFNSLVQVVLKMTCPGVPDFYRGTELWDYSLVDPDNRRPVDYALRKALLADLRDRASEPSCDLMALVKLLFKNHQNGQIKLYLIWRTLELRRRCSRLFAEGSYLPLPAAGPKQEHICAFGRTHLAENVITVAARLVLGLTQGSQRAALDPEVWLQTSLPVPHGKPGDQYRNVFTQQIISLRRDGLPIAEVLGILPVAVLERVEQ